MTTNMVRKQIYIPRRQNALLKRLSQARGLSEAEIIRQAIEKEVAGETVPPAWRTLSAMDDFARLALSKRGAGKQGEPYRWERAEIYAERESRWLKEQDDD